MNGRRRALNRFREAAQAAALALVLFLGTHTAIQAREVLGPSMQPTYHTGERLVINRAIYARINLSGLSRFIPFLSGKSHDSYVLHGPQRGNVIVFKPPIPSQDDFIKRVIGVPGDHVVVGGGRVAVNGRLLDEPYIHGATTACAGPWCDIVLGPNQYYVMVDNRPDSSDSCYWGPVRAGSIAGEAWFIYFPFKDIGPLHLPGQ